MNPRHLLHVVGIILLSLSAALAVAGIVAAVYRGPDVLAFVLSTGITLATGMMLFRRTSLDRDLSIREGYAVVSLAWISIGVAGALPYLLAGVIRSPTAALFESVSGFTTTGATVFSDIESLPHGILFWRSLTQWIGGMGIIVLGVAILPFLGIGGMQLFRAEVPGPTTERLQPRITQTAKLLWLVYAGLTAGQVVLLAAGGIPLFDAVNHAFTTMSTGGFSTQNASIAAYDSGYLQYVFIVFMYLAGINFTLHFRAMTGRPRYHRDSEWKAYTLMVAAATVFVTLVLLEQAGTGGLERTIRDALFQTVSIATTTGYASADFDVWPAGGQFMLLLLMFVGGMAGSTAGGMKVIRVVAFFRQGLTALRRALHPRAVVLTRVSGKALRENDLLTILAFILFYLLLFVAGVFAMTVLGHDLVTSIGASAASIGNIGPGLGDVGATDNYGWMGPFSHLVLTFLMLVGRLEIFTVLLLFHPDLWRRRGARTVGAVEDARGPLPRAPDERAVPIKSRPVTRVTAAALVPASWRIPMRGPAALLSIAALLLSPTGAHAQSAEAEVRAVIDRMFEALRQQDTTTMRDTFHPDFRLAVTSFRDGQPVVRQVGADAFLTSLANAQERLDEQIADVEVRVHDNLATVWNRYNFYVGDRIDHCGVDAFILVRLPEGWKILQVADTQRSEGCAAFGQPQAGRMP